MSEWETFCDESYYSLWRVRRKNERGFNDGYHIHNGEEARALVELLNKLDRERDEFRQIAINAERELQRMEQLVAVKRSNNRSIDARNKRLERERDAERAIADRLAGALMSTDSIIRKEVSLIGQWSSPDVCKEALAAWKEVRKEH